MSKRKIRAASRLITQRINESARGGGFHGAGLANEGYDAGYRDALDDVLLVLDKVHPCNRPHFWEAAERDGRES